MFSLFLLGGVFFPLLFLLFLCGINGILVSQLLCT